MSKVGSAEFTIAAHNRTQRGLAEAERGLKGVASNAKAMFNAFASGYASTKIFQAIGDGMKMMGDAADQAENLGMMGSSLLLLGRAAEGSGAGMDEMVMMLRKLQENTASALSGNKAMADSFKKLGVSATVLRGVAPERALEMLAKAYQSASSDAESFDALLNITGARTAPKLIEVLNRLGTEGLGGLEKQFGRVSESAILAADQMGDTWTATMNDIKLGLAVLSTQALDFWAGVDPGFMDSVANGRAAQADINRRMKAQNDAARAEVENRRAMEETQHKIFMDKVTAADKEIDVQQKALDAQKKLWVMADARIDKEWDLIEAQNAAPDARTMTTMSGADLNSFAQQQTFQASEDRRRAEHERRVERLQNELLAVTKEMRDFAKKNEIKEWD